MVKKYELDISEWLFLSTISEEQPDNEELPTEEQEDITHRKDFRLPKKIRLIKLAICIIINIIMGGVMIALGIVYFVTPVIESSLYYSLFAAFMILVGVFLFGQSPLVVARTVNSRLILGEKKVKIRNAFRWKVVKWDDIQEVLIRQKLTKKLDANDLIGIDIVRFRTVAGGTHFLADNFPVDDAEEIIKSIVESFEDFLEETDYHVHEKAERPSVEYRYLYFNKKIEKE